MNEEVNEHMAREHGVDHLALVWKIVPTHVMHSLASSSTRKALHVRRTTHCTKHKARDKCRLRVLTMHLTKMKQSWVMESVVLCAHLHVQQCVNTLRIKLSGMEST